MRSAWAGGLHLRSRADEKRGAGYGVNTFEQSALIHYGTNARRMLLPAPAGRKPAALYDRGDADAPGGCALEWRRYAPAGSR